MFVSYCLLKTFKTISVVMALFVSAFQNTVTKMIHVVCNGVVKVWLGYHDLS